MDLRDYLQVARKRWRMVTACAVLALLGAGGSTAMTTPTYRATAELFVSARTSGDDMSGAYQGGIFSQQRVRSYTSIVDTAPVTSEVVERLGLPLTPAELAERVEAVNPLDTVLLEVSAVDEDPYLARDIANAVAEEFTDVVRDLETPDGATDALVKATVVEAATAPTQPVAPRPTVNLALGLLLGLAFGAGTALLREYLDTTVKSAEEIKDRTGAPVLGTVPEDSTTSEHPLIVDPVVASSVRAEAYRTVRTNLQFVDVDSKARAVVVTSSVAGEGKTTTACNVALALAEAGTRVVLVEADLRRPRTADYMGLEGSVGLTNLLLDQVELADVLQPWGSLPLSVLPSGAIPPNPSELLGSEQMGQLLATLLEDADVVILDAPPLLPVTDAAVLAARCDGAIFVTRHGHTRRDQVSAAADSLRSVGARLLGTVISRVPTKGSAYAYSYEYGYESDSSRPRLRAEADRQVLPAATTVLASDAAGPSSPLAAPRV